MKDKIDYIKPSYCEHCKKRLSSIIVKLKDGKIIQTKCPKCKKILIKEEAGTWITKR